MKIDRLVRIVAVIAAAFLVGCASYYKVTDPASGRVYYTHDVDRKGTAAMFKDAKTGAEVTLPASEVVEVTSEEFKQNVPSR